jgi:mannose-6-phosphate isomerase
MHLLEAALAWSAIDSDLIWRELADEMGQLCLDRLIEKRTGALREFFAQDWAPLHKPEAEVVEPGHHYEWAYLLDRWAKTTKRNRPEEVSRLIAFADANGIDRERSAAVNEIRLDGSARDPVARLWPQTERLRTYVIDRDTDDDPRLREAIATLWRYLDAPLRGLWYENLDAKGQFIVEAAPATSLYHIVGAVMELCAALGSQVEFQPQAPG